MPKSLVRVACYLLIPSLLMGLWGIEATFDARDPRVCEEDVLTAQALAARATAFHHHKAAILVCGLAGPLLIGGAALAIHDHPSHFWVPAFLFVSPTISAVFSAGRYPPEVLEYFQSVSNHIALYEGEIKKQILGLRVDRIKHETEAIFGASLDEHLVIGPKGFWLHSHLNQLGNGTLIEVERDRTGRWKPVKVLIEWAHEPRHTKVPPCFFNVDRLTKRQARRQAILASAEPYVTAFQEPLNRTWNSKDATLSIALAMGRGITPGTEAAWVIEPQHDWEPETGLWMDPLTGWVFLRADKNRESISPADEAVFILRSWAKMIDRANRESNEFFHFPWPVTPERITHHTLPILIPWIERLRFHWVSYRKDNRAERIDHQITPEEIAYIKYLIQRMQADPESNVQKRRDIRRSLLSLSVAA